MRVGGRVRTWLVVTMFWMKSRCALPPRCITKTARCCSGSLMHVFSMRISTAAYLGRVRVRVRVRG